MIAALFDIVNDVAFHVAGVLLCNADRTQTESTTQTRRRRNQPTQTRHRQISQRRPDADRSANADPTQTGKRIEADSAYLSATFADVTHGSPDAEGTFTRPLQNEASPAPLEPREMRSSSKA
jgi:hypothetical protein